MLIVASEICGYNAPRKRKEVQAMLLYNIANVDKLYSVLDNCSGNVDMILPDGKAFSWKDSREVAISLSSAMPNKALDSLELKVHNGKDLNRIISFMMNEEA